MLGNPEALLDSLVDFHRLVAGLEWLLYLKFSQHDIIRPPSPIILLHGRTKARSEA